MKCGRPLAIMGGPSVCVKEMNINFTAMTADLPFKPEGINASWQPFNI